MALVVPGLFFTVALPAYAHSTSADAVDESAAGLQQFTESGAQSVANADVASAAVARDSYGATSAAEMLATQRAAQRQAQAAAYRAYTGPTVSSYLANPPYPSFSLDQVVQVALQYQGVPYRYGGADPSGFDCSGFSMYVYAQFGISLPHSSTRQGNMTRISPADAQPGDLVIMSGGGHLGIYMGGNTMLDAPKPGMVVQVREIYDPNHWFVRVGI